MDWVTGGAYDFLSIEKDMPSKAPLPPCSAWFPSPAAAGEALGYGYSLPPFETKGGSKEMFLFKQRL